MKKLVLVSSDAVSVTGCIERLESAGVKVDTIAGGLYNLTSSATGAVLARCIDYKALESYVRCMEYVARKHKSDIRTSYSYTKPVHTTIGVRKQYERKRQKRAIAVSG